MKKILKAAKFQDGDICVVKTTDGHNYSIGTIVVIIHANIWHEVTDGELHQWLDDDDLELVVRP